MRTWEAWLSLAVGTLMVTLGGLQLLVADTWHVDPVIGFTQLLTGSAFLAMAGLQVGRPAAENRQQVVLYRIVHWALTVPLLLGVGALVRSWIG